MFGVIIHLYGCFYCFYLVPKQVAANFSNIFCFQPGDTDLNYTLFTVQGTANVYFSVQLRLNLNNGIFKGKIYLFSAVSKLYSRPGDDSL